MNVRAGLGHEPRLLLTALSLAWLCACAAGDGSAPGSDPCGGPAPATLADTGTIVVRGEDPPCTLEFVEVVTLAGDPDEGALPELPIAAAPGGGWVTATYDPGQIAFWSPTGAFEWVIGNGPATGRANSGARAGSSWTRLPRLIATAVWDYWRDAPSPLRSPSPSGLWYRVLDDATRSIRILRPVLNPVRGGP